MATPPKRWPNNAEWARLDSIHLANQGRKDLLNALDGIDNPVILRRIAKAIDTFTEIETKLISVGPKNE
jgi:hypothetical protein